MPGFWHSEQLVARTQYSWTLLKMLMAQTRRRLAACLDSGILNYLLLELILLDWQATRICNQDAGSKNNMNPVAYQSMQQYCLYELAWPL